MQLRSKTVDLEPLLNSVRKSNEPLTREEIANRSGLTYQQLRKQLPKLIQSGDIGWYSSRVKGREIRLYWATSAAAMLIVLPSIVTFPVDLVRHQSRITQAA